MGVNLCLSSLGGYDKTVMCKSKVIKIFSWLSKIFGRRLTDTADWFPCSLNFYDLMGGWRGENSSLFLLCSPVQEFGSLMGDWILPPLQQTIKNPHGCFFSSCILICSLKTWEYKYKRSCFQGHCGFKFSSK